MADQAHAAHRDAVEPPRATPTLRRHDPYQNVMMAPAPRTPTPLAPGGEEWFCGGGGGGGRRCVSIQVDERASSRCDVLSRSTGRFDSDYADELASGRVSVSSPLSHAGLLPAGATGQPLVDFYRAETPVQLAGTPHARSFTSSTPLPHHVATQTRQLERATAAGVYHPQQQLQQQQQPTAVRVGHPGSPHHVGFYVNPRQQQHHLQQYEVPHPVSPPVTVAVRTRLHFASLQGAHHHHHHRHHQQQPQPHHVLPSQQPQQPQQPQQYSPPPQSQPQQHPHQPSVRALSAADSERAAQCATCPMPERPSPIAVGPRSHSSVSELPLACPERHFTNVALAPQHTEPDAHRCSQRQKQVDLGKSTEGYQRYIATVPRGERQWQNEHHPVTPRVEFKCSKRAFDESLRQWRRQLHLWDDPVVDGGRVAGLTTLADLGLEPHGAPSGRDGLACTPPPVAAGPRRDTTTAEAAPAEMGGATPQVDGGGSARSPTAPPTVRVGTRAHAAAPADAPSGPRSSYDAPQHRVAHDTSVGVTAPRRHPSSAALASSEASRVVAAASLSPLAASDATTKRLDFGHAACGAALEAAADAGAPSPPLPLPASAAARESTLVGM